MKTGVVTEQIDLSLWEAEFDQYQQDAVGLIRYDENGKTIDGWEPLLRLRQGIYEEYAEILYNDDDEAAQRSSYDRFAVITGRQPPNVDPKQRELHLKEFGDMAWYVGTYIFKAHGIKLSEAARAVSVAELDALPAVPGPSHEPSGHMAPQQLLPDSWRDVQRFRNSAHALFVALGGAVDQESLGPDDREEIITATSQFLGASALLLERRFGEEGLMLTVLDDNIAKIKGRDERGTVIGSGNER